MKHTVMTKLFQKNTAIYVIFITYMAVFSFLCNFLIWKTFSFLSAAWADADSTYICCRLLLSQNYVLLSPKL